MIIQGSEIVQLDADFLDDEEILITLFQYPVALYLKFVDSLDGCAGITQWRDINNHQDIEMLIAKDANLDDMFEIILHELVHVKQFLEEFIEIDLDRESEAYFISRLFSQIKTLVEMMIENKSQKKKKSRKKNTKKHRRTKKMNTDYKFTENELNECIDKDKMLRIINYYIQSAINENNEHWYNTCHNLELQLEEALIENAELENKLQDYHNIYGDLPTKK